MRVLKIQNLILIEKAEIHFGPGLNIITGETGSGKSALFAAIHLIAGERGDRSLVRNGAEMAIVEAEFEGGRFIRREIYASGKGRCFIDDAQVSLAELKEAVAIELVNQNASLVGKEEELLDQFGSLTRRREELKVLKKEEREIEYELNESLQVSQEREIEWVKKDLEWIEEINYRLGEEELLKEDHERLVHAGDLSENIGALTFLMVESAEMGALKKGLHLLEASSKLDPKLKEAAQAMRGAVLELDEVGQVCQKYSEHLESNPEKLAQVEKRIGSVASLKKRFGPDIAASKTTLLQKLDHLLNLESKIGQLRARLQELHQKNKTLTAHLYSERKQAAPKLSALILSELKSLNIPYARFEIQVLESVQFYFSANPGHPLMPMAECASGGEMSRLLLAIKLILSEGQSSLVFDEIDSNIGGQTAAILGEKLKELGKKRQIICVTHFVQVAKCAIDHYRVIKTTEGSSSFTKVEKLNGKEKENEYNRMLGSSK